MGIKLKGTDMKRVLILLLFVLVVGCAEKPDTGPDSDWECPSCHWGVGEKALECPNCGDVFKPRFKYYEGIDGKMDYTDPIISGHIPVKRKK